MGGPGSGKHHNKGRRRSGAEQSSANRPKSGLKAEVRREVARKVRGNRKFLQAHKDRNATIRSWMPGWFEQETKRSRAKRASKSKDPFEKWVGKAQHRRYPTEGD